MIIIADGGSTKTNWCHNLLKRVKGGTSTPGGYNHLRSKDYINQSLNDNPPYTGPEG